MSPEVRRRRRSDPVRRIRRRVRRLRTERPVAFGLACTGLLLLLLVVWGGWVAWSAAKDLREVESQGQIMRAALIRGDAEGARRAMNAYQDAAESAEERTSGPTWAVAELLPVVGDDAEGVATVSRVLADIGRDGLPPVADAADDVTADAFQPTKHVFPLERIASLEQPAERSQRAFDAADAELDEVDPSGFVGPVATRFEQLRTLVGDARSTLGSTYRAARLMPALLGADGPRNYLMVLQNNAEARSSGGLPGSLSMVRADRGRVRIVEQTDMASLGVTDRPVLPLTAEEEEVFGRILGTIGVDATLTPDFQRAADLIRARWELVKGQRVDGVFFVDPVTISYLLRGTGPVVVPGNASVTPLNVVSRVENEIYILTPFRAEHSDYQNAVAKAVFNTFADGRGDTAESIRGLVSGVSEGRIRMALFREEDHAEIAGTKIAGEFPKVPDSTPDVGLYINDGGPTKMQFYLRYDATLYARTCADDESQELGGTIELHNDSPADVASLPPTITGETFPGHRTEPGEQILVIYLTSPVEGVIEQISVDGQRVTKPVIQRLAGRQLATIGVRLDPQQRQTIDFVVRSGPGQPGDPELSVTPGALPGTAGGTAPTSC